MASKAQMNFVARLKGAQKGGPAAGGPKGKGARPDTKPSSARRNNSKVMKGKY